MDRIDRGDRLTPAEIRELAGTPDILSLGMLADAVAARLHGTRVTFLRVADLAFDGVGRERAAGGARSPAHRYPDRPRRSRHGRRDGKERGRRSHGRRLLLGRCRSVERREFGRSSADATAPGRTGRDCGAASRHHRRSGCGRAKPEDARDSNSCVSRSARLPPMNARTCCSCASELQDAHGSFNRSIRFRDARPPSGRRPDTRT